MKRLIYILIIGLVVALCSYGKSNDVSKKVNDAICLGQSSGIAEYLAPEVSFVMRGSKSTCTKGEVEQVLHEFFRQNKPSQFLGTTDNGFFSGKLTTSEGKSYMVEYRLKNIDDKEVITVFYVN